MGSQVISKNQSQMPGTGTDGKEDKEEEPPTKRRKECTNLGFEKEHLACHASALAMTDEECREVEILA